MIKLGLTGGIGSGKSTVSRILRTKGIPIIDADKIARDIFVIHPELLDEIRKEFGEEFFDEDGNLLRRKLGNLIFSDDSKRKKLESMTVPVIIDEINKRINDLENRNRKMCIIDAPTLIESGFYKHVDKVILVYVDLNTQMERIMRRDGFSISEAESRIKAQMTLDDKKKYADYIIDNTRDLSYLKTQVEKILSTIFRRQDEI